MAAPRKTRRTPSTTSSKSSETQTEKPQSASQESEPKFVETSTQTTDENPSSSSTLSDDDRNDALFANADAEALGDAESDDDELDEDEDADDGDRASEDDSEAPSEDGDEIASVKRDGETLEVDKTGNVIDEKANAVTGKVHTFNVRDDVGEYTFRGLVDGNTIIVEEHAWRERSLRGTTATTQTLVHHKGQSLPLSSYAKFADNLED